MRECPKVTENSVITFLLHRTLQRHGSAGMPVVHESCGPTQQLLVSITSTHMLHLIDITVSTIS